MRKKILWAVLEDCSNRAWPIQVFIQVDKWDHFQNGSQDFFFSFLFFLLVFIYFFKYETIVRSIAWFFGHSDTNPSSV